MNEADPHVLSWREKQEVMLGKKAKLQKKKKKKKAKLQNITYAVILVL